MAGVVLEERPRFLGPSPRRVRARAAMRRYLSRALYVPTKRLAHAETLIARYVPDGIFRETNTSLFNESV